MCAETERLGAARRSGRRVAVDERDRERPAQRRRALLEGHGRVADVARLRVAERRDDRAVTHCRAQQHVRRGAAGSGERQHIAGVGGVGIFLRHDDREGRRRRCRQSRRLR